MYDPSNKYLAIVAWHISLRLDIWRTLGVVGTERLTGAGQGGRVMLALSENSDAALKMNIIRAYMRNTTQSLPASPTSLFRLIVLLDTLRANSDLTHSTYLSHWRFCTPDFSTKSLPDRPHLPPPSPSNALPTLPLLSRNAF
jgi:hypothetical protein